MSFTFQRPPLLTIRGMRAGFTGAANSDTKKSNISTTQSKTVSGQSGQQKFKDQHGEEPSFRCTHEPNLDLLGVLPACGNKATLKYYNVFCFFLFFWTDLTGPLRRSTNRNSPVSRYLIQSCPGPVKYSDIK